MTEIQQETLKKLLGLPEEEENVLIGFVIENAEEMVKNYCHIKEIPQGLLTTVLRMAADIYRNEQFGDGEVPMNTKSMSEGDVSMSFGTVESSGYSDTLLKNYEKTLNRYRRVVF